MEKLSEEDLKKAWKIRSDAMDRFSSRVFHKYNKGQEEHGGLLTDRVCLDDLEDEIIDLWFYLQALKIKLKDHEQ